MKSLLVAIGIMLTTITTASATRHVTTNGVQYHRAERKVVHHHRGSSHRSARHHIKKPHRIAHKHPVGLHIASASVGESDLYRSVGTGALTNNSAPEDQFTILSDYAYSEVAPVRKPADQIKEALADIPEDSVRSEIKLIAGISGLDVGLLNAFAQIESDFNPHNRTGSYLGLYQLSRHEFSRYGPTDGDIFDARDNAIAAALKIEYEANLFKLSTRHIPSNADLYLIHQQGLQGAAQHLADPDRPAWQSMCATDEGHQRGSGWCRKAIWGNTLPAVKRIWKSVESLTSGAFVAMWRDRVMALLGVRPRPEPEPTKVATKEDHHVDHERNKTREVRVHEHHHHVVHSHHHLRHYAKA